MSPDTIEEISVLTRSGFYTKDDLARIFGEEMYEPGELDPEEIARVIDDEWEKLAEERLTWPKVTDCDRLDKAFAAMNGRGVIALQNAGNTQSDGYGDFLETLKAAPDAEGVVGYCFYHGQDLERAVRGAGLYLAFGPVDPDEEETAGVEAGRIVKEELERAGLPVEWDGTFSERILIPLIVWLRR